MHIIRGMLYLIIRGFMKFFLLLFCVLIFVSCKEEKNSSKTSNPVPVPTPSSSTMNSYGYQDKVLYSFSYNETIKKDSNGNTVSLGVYGKRYKEYALFHNGGSNIDATKIGFDSSLASNVLGVCYINQNKIFLNPNFWFSPNTTNSKRELVLFHELGHCSLQRLHEDGEIYTIDTGMLIEQSIMNSYAIEHVQYEKNHNYYINELFDENYSTTGLYTYKSNEFNNSYYGVLDKQNVVKKVNFHVEFPTKSENGCIIYE